MRWLPAAGFALGRIPGVPPPRSPPAGLLLWRFTAFGDPPAAVRAVQAEALAADGARIPFRAGRRPPVRVSVAGSRMRRRALVVRRGDPLLGVLVAEGPPDALASILLGYAAPGTMVLGVPGASLTASGSFLPPRFGLLTVVVDPDGAGRRAARRLRAAFPGHPVSLVEPRLPGGLPADAAAVLASVAGV